MWQDIVCPLCGADNYRVLYTGSLLNEENQQVFACTNVYWSSFRRIVSCRACGMIYNNPCETRDTLLQNYREVIDKTYLHEVPGRQKTFARAINRLKQFHPPPAKLLDVGCYTGHFATAAAAAGYQVYGIELSRWAADFAKNELGITICGETLADLQPEQLFDCITMWDVIEHVPDPHKVIAQAAEHLRPGGILALSTHNMNSFSARVLRSRYPFLMQMHVAHFTPDTLQRLFSHHNLRLFHYEPHWRWIRIGYALEKLRSYSPRLFKAFEFCQQQFPGNIIVPVIGLGLINVYAQKEQDNNA